MYVCTHQFHTFKGYSNNTNTYSAALPLFGQSDRAKTNNRRLSVIYEGRGNFGCFFLSVCTSELMESGQGGMSVALWPVD